MQKEIRHGAFIFLLVLVVLAIAAGMRLAAIERAGQAAVIQTRITLPAADSAVSELDYGSWPALASPGFFREVRERFQKEGADFISADLSRMELTVYRSGIPEFTVPIKTKGREGSWWETPAGLYKIESKERNHFSSFGRVNQPWSMAFQGNFFIHGWPTHPDGQPVASTYSGGCIRLETADAKRVFDAVKIGTPVLVYAKQFESDSFSYGVNPPISAASSSLVADLKNGTVLFAKDPAAILPIASLTKLMTALVAAEYINLDRDVVVSSQSIVFTSKPRLKAGETYQAYNLLFPLMLESSNEAAFALADHLGRERFVSLMNKKAQALGMAHTKFADPAGMSEENISTAEDLFVLARYLLNNRSFILKLSAGKLMSETAYGQPTFKNLQNFNVFDGDVRFLGGKVGETKAARQTILSIFDMQFKDAIRPIVIIVLGSEDRARDAQTLRDAVAQTYR